MQSLVYLSYAESRGPLLEHDGIAHIKEVTCENASKHIYVVVEMYGGGGGVNVGEIDIGVSYRLWFPY